MPRQYIVFLNLIRITTETITFHLFASFTTLVPLFFGHKTRSEMAVKLFNSPFRFYSFLPRARWGIAVSGSNRKVAITYIEREKCTQKIQLCLLKIRHVDICRLGWCRGSAWGASDNSRIEWFWKLFQDALNIKKIFKKFQNYRSKNPHNSSHNSRFQIDLNLLSRISCRYIHRHVHPFRSTPSNRD